MRSVFTTRPRQVKIHAVGQDAVCSEAAGYGNFRWRCGPTACCCCKAGSGSGSSSSRVEAACLLPVEVLARVALDGDVPKFPRAVAAHCKPGRRKALHLEPHCVLHVATQQQNNTTCCIMFWLQRRRRPLPAASAMITGRPTPATPAHAQPAEVLPAQPASCM